MKGVILAPEACSTQRTLGTQQPTEQSADKRSEQRTLLPTAHSVPGGNSGPWVTRTSVSAHQSQQEPLRGARRPRGG